MDRQIEMVMIEDQENQARRQITNTHMIMNNLMNDSCSATAIHCFKTFASNDFDCYRYTSTTLTPAHDQIATTIFKMTT